MPILSSWLSGLGRMLQLAKDSGIEMNRGIVVNDYLETSIPNIYSVANVRSIAELPTALVAPLYEQGAILAKKLAGVESDGYQGSVVSTKLKVSGVDVFSAGRSRMNRVRKRSACRMICMASIRRSLFENGKVVGAVCSAIPLTAHVFSR